MAGTDASRRPGRLGVGIIGAGKVGAVLGAALRSAGHAVVGVSAVSAASRGRAENLLPGVPVLDVRDIVERAELVVLAIPDDALPELVDGLARLGAWQAGQLVMHTSGRYGISVLAAARAAGAIPLAIHPAMTFTGLSLDLGRLPDSAFGITAPAAVLPIAQALVVEMGGEPVVVEEESRTLYHAALAHSSNHLVTIAAQSAQLLGDIGVQHPDRMLGPLMKASLENALSSGEGALTGPVARGDAGTVTAHRAALEAHDAPDVRQAYLGMARATALRALERGVLPASQGAVILAALADPTTVGPESTGESAQESGRPGAAGTSGDPRGDGTALAEGSMSGPEVPDGAASAGPRAPQVVTTSEELRAATTTLLERVRSARDRPSLGLVPTMGGLHEGHAALVRAAREANDVVVVSIFVNPLQFGDSADLARYPRTLDDDLRLLADAGADVVLAPAVEDMYPGGEPLVRLSAGRMGEVLEGASRPGHFDGMLTVVAKLLNIGKPDVAADYRAYFGEKDAQQLALIRRMVSDLDVPVQIEGVPTVRDADGLALSSRNRFLAPEERGVALVLSRVLAELRGAAVRGEVPDVGAARAAIAAVDGVELDYLEVVDPASFTPVHDGDTKARTGALAVVAAKVGAVRLIDNTVLPPAEG